MELERDGAELSGEHLSDEELSVLTDLFETVGGRAGKRIRGDARARALVADGSTLLDLARLRMGKNARAVRLVLFDKTADHNWGVAWHQDRTIAVKERREVDGFGPWSTKDGVPHVAPPYPLLASMITMRAHLDPCDETNAPLVVARGSHRIGIVSADLAAAAASEFPCATCLAKPGDVWLYRTPILHMSKPASRPARRRVLQVDFAAAELPGGLEWAEF